MKITQGDITKDFLTKYDGEIAWIRDDYLCLIGYSDDDEVTKILEKVIELKSEMRKEGYIFKA